MTDIDEQLDAWIDTIAPLAERFGAVERVPAWIGVRWEVRGKSFAHVAPIIGGKPASYARESGTDGPAVCLTFYIDGPELQALANVGPPFFKPPWSPTVVGMLLDDDTDLEELGELITDSYCTRAPKRLAEKVDRPMPDED